MSLLLLCLLLKESWPLLEEEGSKHEPFGKGGRVSPHRQNLGTQTGMPWLKILFQKLKYSVNFNYEKKESNCNVQGLTHNVGPGK